MREKASSASSLRKGEEKFMVRGLLTDKGELSRKILLTSQTQQLQKLVQCEGNDGMVWHEVAMLMY